MPALCRDCLSEIAPARRCSACGSPRISSHPELFDLSIAHMDCDAFYASVEKRDNPALNGKPVIIGGGRRGVVSTACYIARIKGVRSAMPMFQALKLCPEAIIIKPRMDAYVEASRAIRAMMEELTPALQPLSLDEAFLDMTGTTKLHGAPPAVMLARLVRRMKVELGLTGSIGLSHNKFLAKVASDLDKPHGFSVIGKEETQRFLNDKPVSMIINTHTHGDHVGSNVDFLLPVEVVAHANTKANMERMEPFQSANGQQYLPTQTYQDRLTLLDGDDRIDLYHFGAGHTSGDSIVVFPALGVAHTGDLFAWKGVPYIDVGNGGSGISYPKTLLAAADGITGIDTVIPGHSPVMTWADFREFGEFNRDFLTAVERGRAEGKSSAETAASLNLPARYANYAMSRGTLTSAADNAEKIYAELDQ